VGNGTNMETNQKHPISDLPERLHPIIEEVVAHAINKAPLPKRLSEVVEWFEGEGWDHICSATDENYTALKLFYLAWLKFSDQELEANQEELVPITSEVRLSYARSLIAEALETSDGYDCPTVHAVTVANAQGQSATLGWLIEIHGQGGPVAEFQGVFPDKAAFYQSLRDTDYVLQTEQDDVKDETILRLWTWPTRNVKVSVTWGNELYECPMSQRSWNRVKAGKALKRVEPFYYEGKRYKANWCFNYSGFGSLLVTNSDDAVCFDGDLSAAQIVIGDSIVAWAK
jgi:hypothetical protein